MRDAREMHGRGIRSANPDARLRPGERRVQNPPDNREAGRMTLRFAGIGRRTRIRRSILRSIVVVLLLLPGIAASADTAPPPAADMMSSAGWMERIAMKLESEAMSDV